MPVLERGVRWRVGDGESIRLWKDSWLGGEGSGKLITPARVLDPEATVSVLIDNEHNTWKLDTISDIFFPIDRDRIRQIPISTCGASDERVWVASNDGQFRVRDMYNLALKEQFEASSSNGSDPLWKQLWKMHIHPKAKIFLWRASWDILPHGSNLCRKGINISGVCNRCGLIETNEHVLKDCAWSRKVWLNFMSSSNIPQNMSFRDWLGKIMANNNSSELELFGICAWQIWCARNDLCFEKVHIPPNLCYKKALDLLSEFKLANVRDGTGPACRENAKWVAPIADTIKLNVDAAINTKEDRFGVGVVARNNLGEVLLSASRTQWPIIFVENAEIEAFKWALEIAKEQQWNSITIEGDALNVVNALQGKISRGFHDQVIIHNILAAARSMHDINFCFCFREANYVAHRLAKWASASICNSIWQDGGPSWISDIVFSDFAT